jgi:hydroxymethylglutaryl-CoA lyase
MALSLPPEVALGLHLHDTLGLGLVNAVAGLDSGVRLFDASIGGIGGCPFSPGATGNVCTEDLVNLFEALGWSTGIDLDLLVGAAVTVSRDLGYALPGHLVSIAAKAAGAGE